MIVVDVSKYYNEDGYYDGIPPEIAEYDDKLTLEELEAELEVARKKCDEMEEW